MLQKSQIFYSDYFTHETLLTYDTRERYNTVFQLISDLQADYTASVLEIGSGSGRISQFLAERFRLCALVDIIQSNLLKAILQQHTNLVFTQAALPYLPFPDNTFDVIIFSEVLEHLETNVQDIALVEIERVLVPGGRCVLSTPNLQSIHEIIRRLLGGVKRMNKVARGGQLVENYLAAALLRRKLESHFLIEKMRGSYYLMPPQAIIENVYLLRKVSEIIGDLGWFPSYGLYQYYILRTNKLP